MTFSQQGLDCESVLVLYLGLSHMTLSQQGLDCESVLVLYLGLSLT